MRNAILTGILAGVMGYGSVTMACDPEAIEYQISVVEAEANEVAADVASAEEETVRLMTARNDYLGQLQELSVTRRGSSSDEAAWLQAAVDQLNQEIEDLAITMAEMQQTLAELVNTIERMTSRMNSSDDPIHPLGEPAN